MNNYTLEAALSARAKELKNQKAAKAERTVMGTDAHLRGYQAARKIDNGASVTMSYIPMSSAGKGAPKRPTLAETAERILQRGQREWLVFKGFPGCNW
jgi:hypothetical protein